MFKGGQHQIPPKNVVRPKPPPVPPNTTKEIIIRVIYECS